MNRITFRIAIALLTFAVGVTTVSLWLFLRHGNDERVEQEQNQQVSNENNLTNTPIPRVKWLYLNNRVYGSSWMDAFGYITIFYENGDWARVHVSLKKNKETKDKIEIGFSNGGYGTEIGKWEKKNDDTLKITIENCKCILCEAEYDPTKDFGEKDLKTLLPIVEICKVKNEFIKQKRVMAIESSVEKYWLIERDDFLWQEALDDVISARYLVWKDYKSLGEPCSKFPRYRELFNTKR
jgi:hypothetical protein